MAATIGTFLEFKKIIPPGLEESQPARQGALEIYLSMGGVAKFEKTDGFPRLAYPTTSRLETQIRESEAKLTGIESQIRAWNKRHDHLKTNKAADMAARAADPMYWEHRAKLVTDPAYRATYDLVRPPMHLLHREKWRKRLKLFIRSKEYRLRLHESRTSKIGKKRAHMTDETEMRMDFNRKMATHELKKLLSKKKEIRKKVGAMNILKAWVKSSN